MAAHAEALIAGLGAQVPAWVERLLVERLGPDRGRSAAGQLSSTVDAALDRVALLLRTDIDQQRANPLAEIRALVDPITTLLLDHGLPDVPRDPDSVRILPGDRFALAPAAFADIHEELHMLGLQWGAAKAHVHLQRRRAEGMR